jgi:hypothetical protein
LYDIETDRTETRDLVSKYPDRVNRLAAAWDEWAHIEPWDKVQKAPRTPAPIPSA